MYPVIILKSVFDDSKNSTPNIQDDEFERKIQELKSLSDNPSSYILAEFKKLSFLNSSRISFLSPEGVKWVKEFDTYYYHYTPIGYDEENIYLQYNLQ